MPVCAKCSKQYPKKIIIDGRIRNLNIVNFVSSAVLSDFIILPPLIRELKAISVLVNFVTGNLFIQEMGIQEKNAPHVGKK